MPGRAAAVSIPHRQGFDDGDKRVAVVIAKRREPMTLKTDLQKFRQGNFPQAVLFPQFFRRSITIGSWFMEGFAGFAQRSVDGNDRFPRDNLQPVFNQRGHDDRRILTFSGWP